MILLAGLPLIYSLAHLYPRTRALSNKTLKVQAYSIAFFTIWVIACMIPYMIYFANRSAGVKAFLGELELPPAIVAQTVARSGKSTRYRTMWYCRSKSISASASSSSLLANSVFALHSSAPPRYLPVVLHRLGHRSHLLPSQDCPCCRSCC